jgi:IclR family transcriptional regulator, KDG regulon repressor
MPRKLCAIANVAGCQDGFEPEGNSPTVKSAKRVLQILELFKEAHGPLSTTDIATLFNYPISSTAALLKSLATLGYLHFDKLTRTYQASLRVGLLGGWSYGGSFVPDILNRVTERLARQSGHTVVLALRNEIHIQYIRIVASEARVRYCLPVGSRQRLVDTPMGRALLSLDQDAAIDRLVHRANADRSESQPRIDPAELRAQIRQIRRTGYVYSRNDFFNGAGGVAGAVPAPSNEPPLVLGLCGPAVDVERDRQMLIELVLSAAREIRTSVESDTGEPIDRLGRCVARPDVAPAGLALVDSPMCGALDAISRASAHMRRGNSQNCRTGSRSPAPGGRSAK